MNKHYVCIVNNARVYITSRTIEINTVNDATRTVWHLLAGDIGFEHLELGRFPLRSEYADIFLASLNHGDITIIIFVKHLLNTFPNFLVHLVVRLLQMSHF